MYRSFVIFLCLTNVKGFLLHDRSSSTVSPTASVHTFTAQELLRLIDEERYLRTRLENEVSRLSAQVKTLEEAVTTLYDAVVANITQNVGFENRLKDAEKKIENIVANFGNTTIPVSTKDPLFDTRLRNLENKTTVIDIQVQNFTSSLSSLESTFSHVENKVTENVHQLATLNVSLSYWVGELRSIVSRQELQLLNISADKTGMIKLHHATRARIV